MKTSLLNFLFIFFAVNISAQITLSGVVIDASSNKPLSFANVFAASGKGGITNEKGKFIIEVNKMPKMIQVSYVGYETKDVKLEEGKFFYRIKITPASTKLTEVQVLANDKKAAAFFYEAIEKSRKASFPMRNSKVFRRTYSTIDKGTPTELLEAFYNAEITEGGVRSFELKNGRIGIPVKSYILNLDLCRVLEHYNFYGDNHDYFPASPLQLRSLKKLIKDYNVRFKGSYVTDRDTIVEITFESEKINKAFSGVAFINKSNKYIIRVIHQIDKAAFMPFETIWNKEETWVENLGIRWDTGFDFKEEGPQPKYMHLILDFDYLTNEKRSPLTTNTKLFFYDYESLFESPIYGENEELNDYDKIMSTPYNHEFWRRATILPETGIEEVFRKDLESKRLFVNSNPYMDDLELLNNKYQLIRDDTYPSWRKVTDSRSTSYKRHTKSTMGTDTYNGLYAKTFLSLDYNCFPDSNQFEVMAVLDYKNSFMFARNEMEANFFIKILQYSNLHAIELEKYLTEKYKEKCPTKNELMQDRWNAEKDMKKEIFAKFNGQNKRDQNYLEELDARLISRQKKLQEQ